MPQNAIYTGTVYHARHKPFFHDYRYAVFALFVDIDELPNLDQNLRLFSFNRWNLLSLYNNDHAARDGTAMRGWLEQACAARDIDITQSRIFILAFPRVMGYVFNPITIFFIYNNKDILQTVVYEVKNTFGDQHGYVLPVEKQSQKGRVAQDAEKRLHVSPFFHMDCHYYFRLYPPGDELTIAIHQFNNEGDKVLTALWDGTRKPLTDSHILRQVLRKPFMTRKVITAIHWQALRLWLRGAKYIPRPKPPKQDTS